MVSANEVAIRSGVGGNASAVLAESTGSDMFADLERWARAAQAAHQVAVTLVQTNFVPQQYRGKPHEATAAILAGAEMGLSPMGSLRAFDDIQGTAAPKAITLRAVVQSKGHQMWEEESSDTRAVVCGIRKGENRIRRSEWDIERAVRLKLTGKDNWTKQPKAMLLARATAECARLVAADAILGIAYSSEELADDEPVRATATVTGQDLLADRPHPTRDGGPSQAHGEVAPTTRRPTTPDTARLEPEEAGPVIDIGDAPVVDQPSTGRLITPAQSKKLHALLGQTGRGDRDEGLRYLNLLLRPAGGPPITSTKDLSRNDATVAIDDLEAHVRDDGPTYEDVPLPEPTDVP